MALIGSVDSPISGSRLRSHLRLDRVLLSNILQIYGQVDRNIQALSSSQMVGGYTTHGAAVTIPPNNYTYSDTGMFQNSDGTHCNLEPLVPTKFS
jgi:hypothetical protein